MGTCVSKRWLSTLSTFSVANTGGARTRPHRAVQCILRRLIEQAGGYADVERHVPELYDWVSNDNDAAPKVISWTWSPGSVCDARMQNVTTKVRRNQENYAIWHVRETAGL